MTSSTSEALCNVVTKSLIRSPKAVMSLLDDHIQEFHRICLTLLLQYINFS